MGKYKREFVVGFIVFLACALFYVHQTYHSQDKTTKGQMENIAKWTQIMDKKTIMLERRLIGITNRMFGVPDPNSTAEGSG